MTVLDPDAQKKATEVIGYKMDRVATLHGLGAGLFFRSVFPSNETPKDTAQLVVETLTLEETGAVDRVAVSKELEGLKEGLKAFREVIVQSVSQDEFRKLSEEARHATQLPPIRA